MKTNATLAELKALAALDIAMISSGQLTRVFDQIEKGNLDDGDRAALARVGHGASRILKETTDSWHNLDRTATPEGMAVDVLRNLSREIATEHLQRVFTTLAATANPTQQQRTTLLQAGRNAMKILAAPPPVVK